jgi:inner membrane protein
MNDTSPVPLTVQFRNASRSLGLKLILVTGLVLLMTIPAFFVDSIVDERTKRAQDAIHEISNRIGGEQTFLGPFMVVPYTVAPTSKGASPTFGSYVVFPTRGEAKARIHAEERHRSLFRVPVYQVDLQFDATFGDTVTSAGIPDGAVRDWTHATIMVAVSNPRAALSDGTITINGKTSTLLPGENIGEDNSRLPLVYLRVRASDLTEPSKMFDVTANLRFSGAQRLAVLAYGKSTHFIAESNWPNPSFDGAFLPAKRTVSPQGFTGEWSVPFIARGVPAEGSNSTVSMLDHTEMGISFIQVADVYQSVSRSLKYELLFTGLLFLSYFTFEATAGKRVHPAQYILVGIAHMIFYLLLLSLAERVGFDWGFLVAGTATVTLLAVNAKWIFASRAQGFRAFVVFSLLYSFIYLLLRLEDNALLVGAVASFLVVAAVMYLTRNLDWYSSLSGTASQPSGAVANDAV